MGAALDRLVLKLARTDVKAYVAKRGNKIVPVVSYMRKYTPAQAEARSHSPEVLADVKAHPDSFFGVDDSIALHRRLGVEEPWNTWEWPRRIAANRLADQKYGKGSTMKQASIDETNDAILGAVARSKRNALAKPLPKPKEKPPGLDAATKKRIAKGKTRLYGMVGITNLYELENEQETAAVENYTSTYAINRAIREDDPKLQSLDAKILMSDLDRAISRSTTTDDLVTWRGTEVPGELRGMEPEDMIGKTYTEKAYTSTTDQEEQIAGYIFKEGAMVEGNLAGPPAKQTILIPPGIHAVDEDLDETAEVILERGLSFRVLDAKYVDAPEDWEIGRYVDMTVEAIPKT